MNKIEIINEINKLGINKNNFWVIGSASLVLRDIIDNANDIDLAFTNNGYEELNSKTKLEFLGEKFNLKWYKVNEIIEFCIDEKTNDKVDSIEPFNLLNLEYYYNHFIKDSTREKDKEKKELLNKILFK